MQCILSTSARFIILHRQEKGEVLVRILCRIINSIQRKVCRKKSGGVDAARIPSLKKTPQIPD